MRAVCKALVRVVVYEPTSKKTGITIAAFSQVAGDLLTSPGRGPNEAEALMEWLREREDAWRAVILGMSWRGVSCWTSW